MTTNTHTLQIEEILYFVNRFPFLLVDRVLDFEATSFARSKKCLCLRAILPAPFPWKTDFPGCADSGSNGTGNRYSAFKSVGKLEPGELDHFAGIDEARFKRPVVPGDQMIMEVTFEKRAAA